MLLGGLPGRLRVFWGGSLGALGGSWGHLGAQSQETSACVVLFERLLGPIAAFSRKMLISMCSFVVFSSVSSWCVFVEASGRTLQIYVFSSPCPRAVPSFFIVFLLEFHRNSRFYIFFRRSGPSAHGIEKRENATSNREDFYLQEHRKTRFQP